MTDALTTQVGVEIVVQSTATPVRVTQESVSVVLGSVPPARVTQESIAVLDQHAAAPIHITQTSVQVLVSWRVKQNFQVVWVE